MNDTILIVDDNEDVLDFLHQLLSDQHNVELATNARDALDILNTKMVNLIISDIMMPDIDGFELCEVIKSNIEFCHIPLILLTSKNTYKARISGIEVGADAYIKKPFSIDLLQLQIKNLLTNRAKIRDHFSNAPFQDVRVMAQSKPDEQFLKKLDDYIRENIRDVNLHIDHISSQMNMSRPTFYRKIKSLSSLSPKELINITRLKKATELIAQNEYSLSEISNMVGYASQSVFGKNFQKKFNMSPIEYRAMLQKSLEK